MTQIINQKDTIIIAKALLSEIRLLSHQGDCAQITEASEIGYILPEDESNTTRTEVTCNKLIEYLCRHPERADLPHFQTLNKISLLNGSASSVA
ncbi:MAG: hypothetical protein ACI93R_002342 [Flavobacteriales bacterium]|jgi:hypothetical protein